MAYYQTENGEVYIEEGEQQPNHDMAVGYEPPDRPEAPEWVGSECHHFECEKWWISDGADWWDASGPFCSECGTGLRADGTEQARCDAVTAEAVEQTLFFATLEMASDPAWPGDINPDATPGGRHLLGLDLIDADGAITDAGRAIHAALTGGQDTRMVLEDRCTWDERVAEWYEQVRLRSQAGHRTVEVYCLTLLDMFAGIAVGQVGQKVIAALDKFIKSNPNAMIAGSLNADDHSDVAIRPTPEVDGGPVFRSVESFGLALLKQERAAADAIIAAQPQPAAEPVPAPMLPGESAADGDTFGVADAEAGFMAIAEGMKERGNDD